ncbi:MAG TPA: hypothetical protein VJ925_07790 [Longimicrobiales bacterium]|nr:hypothetical protein [Longimicrobiales bacterium]
MQNFSVIAAARLTTLLFLVAGCAQESPETGSVESSSGMQPGSSALLTVPESPRPVDAMLFTISGLEGPEAVKYDYDQDVYFISNFGPNETDGANDGHIAKASAETGEVIDLRFMTAPDETPLMEPRGMALRGDELWVADASGVHAFDRTTGDHLRFVDLTGMEIGFLNDMTIGPDGAPYVTDMGNSRVLRITDAGGEVAVADRDVGNPNGITLDESTGELVIVTWGEDAPPFRRWNPATGGLSMGETTPGGRYDGVEFVGNQLLVASQVDQAIHLVTGAEGVPIQSTEGRPADIAVDLRRLRVAVPYIALDRVDVFALTPNGG